MATEKVDSVPPLTDQSNETITISQSIVFFLVGAVLFFIAGFVVAWITFTATIGATVKEARDAAFAARDAVGTVVAMGGRPVIVAGAPTAAPTWTPVPLQTIALGNSPAWGPVNAKVTIVEFSDFQCPFCEVFYKDTYQLLKEIYGDRIRFVFKNFPLSQHPQAYPAALAAECANEQGKFWAYHDLLFQNQQDLGRAALISYAKTAEIPNINQFTICYDSEKYADTIKADISAGRSSFVQATPTFFVNGNFLLGAQPFQTLSNYIEQTLQAGSGSNNPELPTATLGMN